MSTHTGGLYDPRLEHGSCGVGFVVNINGQQSHQIVKDGITILKNLVHRGGVGADGKTGDGAGVLVQLPHGFLLEETDQLGIRLPAAGEYGVGMVFLPPNEADRVRAVGVFQRTISAHDGEVLGWRDVPVRPGCLGEMARRTMPRVSQVFVRMGAGSSDELQRRLYLLRRGLERAVASEGFSLEQCYIVSLSSNTITYKGMCVAQQLETFYPDLRDSRFQSALALIHQRYSTNTFPSWPLAQPMRLLAHNGEINTLRGNVNKMKAREKTLSSDLFGSQLKDLLPIIDQQLSDSAIVDNVFELLCLSGRSVEHAMMMMVPEAFGPKYHISRDKRAFYEYHAAIMEPWDGPAALSFTDGVKVGAALDRNGLRPARYVSTKSGKLVMASEVGVLDIPPEDVLTKGRLGPGKMLLVDTREGRVIHDNEIKATVSRRRQYRRWLEENRIELKGLFQAPEPVAFDEDSLRKRQKAFGYTLEELRMILAPMAEHGQEPVGSMGNDAAPAALSARPQLLYNYFKQLFAQVTNPPIDPYRENLVMSLMSFVGKERNLLDETPQHCRQLKLPHPILTNEDLYKLKALHREQVGTVTLPMLFDAAEGEEGLDRALQALCEETERAVDNGCTLLVLSDREIDERQAAIPALLATSAVHHHLVDVGRRQLTGLVLETGEARDVMHFAMLIGYGASAINPYLALETIAQLVAAGNVGEGMKTETAFDHYITAVKKGLLKIMSKMGVSTIRSYRGAQLFEAVGLSNALIGRYFPGTFSRIDGVGLGTIVRHAVLRHAAGFEHQAGRMQLLDSGGNIFYRSFSEKHLHTPEAIATLQRAVRENDWNCYRDYARLMGDSQQNLCTLRGLFSFKDRTSVPLEEVEGEEAIIKRFVTSAMSLGSISKEAHETIAVAMNRLNAASNSGEGGESEERFSKGTGRDSACSMIKQVASARFGVTSAYLVNCRELQIKMAQGAKPGEGGQLPGHKVDAAIAEVRHSTPGVMLISPPPHHDIYSIEDLAQLIFDLKNANPDARVSVKLVAETGVGTIAAGVAKGKADMVLISGHDGGTGASPISSIKHTGIPWEIGLADTQQTLVRNKLRDRIRVQVDGKLSTGRDVVIGALLGAEEFGFGTAALVCMGCVMMRKCHLNTCPVGVATQDPELRKRFSGRPEYLVNFMRFIARDVRETMAELGFRQFDEMVGRSDILEVNEALRRGTDRLPDFSAVLTPSAECGDGAVRCVTSQQHDYSNSLDRELIEKSAPALDEQRRVSLFASIRNCNRTVGTTLSAEVSKRFGSKGLPGDTIRCKFTGSAGQSFGAFLAPGITFELEGDANDYFGKGLSGGRLIVYPPRRSTFRANTNSITGNVNLFGATDGEAYICGMAGERFAVRNSGATAVVEGMGDHGCEYMTGGTVVVLGRTGVNFAAGMSGGTAFVLDEDQLFDTKCNLEMVEIEPVSSEEDRTLLFNRIQEHVNHTGSEHAARILRDWTEMLPQFVKVIPVEYKYALSRLKSDESKGTEVVAMTEEVYA